MGVVLQMPPLTFSFAVVCVGIKWETCWLSWCSLLDKIISGLATRQRPPPPHSQPSRCQMTHKHTAGAARLQAASRDYPGKAESCTKCPAGFQHIQAELRFCEIRSFLSLPDEENNIKRSFIAVCVCVSVVSGEHAVELPQPGSW